jgi:hypothetical protein
MAIRVRAYTSTPSGGPANASWRYWHDHIRPPELEKASSVIELNKQMIGLYENWLYINYGARIDSHREDNPTNRYTQLVFQDKHMAALFLLRFP